MNETFKVKFEPMSWTMPNVNGLHEITPFVKVLVRWASDKRLANRLPKLSLTTRPTRKTTVVYIVRVGVGWYSLYVIDFVQCFSYE